MDQRGVEVNFDGLVGPTHNYGGLAFGNLASQRHGLLVSNPREAALQGVAKMRVLADLGLVQAVLPPQERPDLGFLRRLGFEGSDKRIMADAAQARPSVLAAAWSASSMWAANAATVCPSADATDDRVHFTAANLVNEVHRSLETAATSLILHSVFADDELFVHHDPLPPAYALRDEGAANHTRLCRTHGEAGIQLFVYGDRPGHEDAPRRFSARQSYEASTAVARLHRIDLERAVFIRQNPAAIDAGVFHNDVIAVGNQNVLFYHAQAFVDTEATVDLLRRRFQQVCGGELIAVEVAAEEVSLGAAVDTYLFNSQLVSLPDGAMALVCPEECRRHDRVRCYLEALRSGLNMISAVHFVDVHQSMRNGGGPACLRLRVVLTETELERMAPGVRFTGALEQRLKQWIRRHYREQLHVGDLADSKLVDESRAALDELTQILALGSIYGFQ